MNNVDQIYDYLGGGWLSLILAVFMGLMFGYLKRAEIKAKLDRAQNETNKNRAKDQAELSEQNQKTQEKWDEGMDEIDRIRKEAEDDSNQ